MKTIIAGSREIDDIKFVIEAINLSKFEVTEIVCGEAIGPDTSGKHWAFIHDVPVKSFPADWNTFKKSAGYIRNEQMAKYADALILVWNGESKGSKHMLDLAIKHQLKFFVLMVKPNGETYVPVL